MRPVGVGGYGGAVVRRFGGAGVPGVAVGRSGSGSGRSGSVRVGRRSGLVPSYLRTTIIYPLWRQHHVVDEMPHHRIPQRPAVVDVVIVQVLPPLGDLEQVNHAVALR